jgi:transcriptional regulator with XRE-family HTH domain
VSKPSVDTLVKIARSLDMPLDILVAEKVYHKNPPENSVITKEIVRLMSMLDDYDALRVLQLVRYSIELFTGEKITIPNEIQSHLKDERIIKVEDIKSKYQKTKIKKKLKPKRALKKFWLD